MIAMSKICIFAAVVKVRLVEKFIDVVIERRTSRMTVIEALAGLDNDEDGP